MQSTNNWREAKRHRQEYVHTTLKAYGLAALGFTVAIPCILILWTRHGFLADRTERLVPAFFLDFD